MDTYPLVSVIVPIYNKQKYISKCLQSLLSQTYTHLEIIVVDDCSTDKSMRIAHKVLKGREDVIFVRNESNIGLLNSRYVGISKAHGEYVAFVDADDWMEPKTIQIMVQAMMEHHPDLVQIRNQRRMSHVPIKYQERFAPEMADRLIAGDDFRILASYVGMDSYIFPACWGKLYCTDKLREATRIEFNQFWGEDQIFNIQYLRECKSIVFCNYVGYNYRWGGQTSAAYKYSSLREYKHVHHIKRLLGQDEECINSEIIMLLRYHTRSLITELGYTKEAVEMLMKDELRDPLWARVGLAQDASSLVEQEYAQIQRSPMKYLAKRLLR